MVFKRIRSVLLFSLFLAFTASSMRADFTFEAAVKSVKGFVQDHPYWTLAGLAAIKLAWNAAQGIIAWTNQVEPRPELKDKKLPIVYSPDSNFNLFGLEKVYWFDAKKYQRIHHYLVKYVGIPAECFQQPLMVSLVDLEKVHTKSYLDVLEGVGAAQLTSKVIEFPVHLFFSDSSVRKRILDPMKLATSGTIMAAQLAVEPQADGKSGWAINLGGGYHHCKGKGNMRAEHAPGGIYVSGDEGHGFCAFGDIQLAIEKLWENNPNLKVMIVDLDAHQGNGHEAYFRDKVQLYQDFHPQRTVKNAGKVAIFDMYNAQIYPGDVSAKQYITYDFPLRSGTKDDTYLAILKSYLPEAIKEFKPDFILYNAGTDIFEEDGLGRLKISQAGIIERDRFVFEQARSHNTPIAMVTSGGYTKQSAVIIGKSIENILKNVLSVIK
jgi:histone deacetylase 11